MPWPRVTARLRPGTRRAAGGAPEWVHLFPDGKMTGRDGRSFDLVDPAAVVLAFQSAGIDLVVDYEHANDRPEIKTGGPVPAAGWIKELKADATGLWGRVEWTVTAAELISNREYRYLSPAMKPWVLALCRNDEASFDRFLKTSIPPFAHLLKSSTDHMRAPPASVLGAALGSDVAEALCAQLGLAPGSLKD